MKTTLHTKIAIIGGGLSGLAAAEALATKGHDVMLFEARQRVGGRILSRQTASGHRYDLGPAWVWPHNRRLLSLIDRLNLTLFPQHSVGRLVFEDPQGAIRRDLEFATMGDALRLEGGMAALTDHLSAHLPACTCRLSHRVTAITATVDQLHISGETSDGPFEATAQRVILALPPRMVAEHIDFAPPLPAALQDRLRRTPTWMAGQAKCVAIYPRAFWRERGLSGDAISHKGPLVEIHDASPDAAASGEAALFGFLAPGQTANADDVDRLKERCVDQLTRLFGPDAATPSAVLLQEWATERETATSADRDTLRSHPLYTPVAAPEAPWHKRLIFAGSETASTEGGFLEGALAAAEAAVEIIATPMSA